ncbi:hypothetical protein RHGRI_025589 [Rhododendron griersonianum]|uniref:Uncharacterized protein n=1 Tax=Rhododendron griersonianum TaxID=479676 RepID=A0AAV6IPP3_9ERIC|nr:hypothetical protein RHGRI_025589 [Rhododendron griersonianum]
METVSDCRTAAGDTIRNTTKHLASLYLDQFVQMDESGKIEEECDTGMLPDDQGCETHDEVEDKKEDTMPTDPNNPFKDIIVYPPGVVPPPRDFDFVEEIPRRSASEVVCIQCYIVSFTYSNLNIPHLCCEEFLIYLSQMFQYDFWQRMKKEREDRIMTTMGQACRTCTNGEAFGCTNGGAFAGFTPPW